MAETGEVFGAEALTREASGGSTITELFSVARTHGAVAELDRRCRIGALRAWLAADVPAATTLFLNVEPESMGTPLSPAERHLLDQLRAGGTPVVLEITEREILGRPSDLLRFREEIREFGLQIAIDDIGSDPASLAILPLVRPDIMKLDTRLMRSIPDRTTAQVVNAVLAEAERSGATVLAEGVETEEDLAFAVSAGAGLGQGWLFGQPTASLPPVSAHQGRPFPPSRNGATPPEPGTGPRTPWDVVSGHKNLLRAETPLLAAISRYVEAQTGIDADATMLLAAFQHRDRVDDGTLRRYQAVAERACLVGMLGVGMESAPTPSVRGHALDPDDPMTDEWTITVLSPHIATALVARQTPGADTDDADRQYDYLLTYDRDLVIEVGRLMLRRFD